MKTRDVYRFYYGSGGPSSKKKKNPPSTQVTSTNASKDGDEGAAKSTGITDTIDANNVNPNKTRG